MKSVIWCNLCERIIGEYHGYELPSVKKSHIRLFHLAEYKNLIDQEDEKKRIENNIKVIYSDMFNKK